MHAYDIGSSTDGSSSVCVHGSSACVGSRATLSCIFTTSSVIGNVVWRKDGIVITDSTPGYTIIQNPSSSTLVTVLLVHNTTLGDDGTYTCSAAMATICKMEFNVVGGMYA